MLILTRNSTESIIVGDDIKITILSVSRGNVRLGFVAPKDVSIYREEIYKLVTKEREENKSDENDE